MTSLAGILGVARGALTAHQTAITVTSHNIANAQTPGFTRQRASLVANVPVGLAVGQVGTGVIVSRIERVRDPLLDVVFRRESGNEAAFGMRRDLLQQVEGIFNEPSATGLASSLDALWSSWDDLANLPNSGTARGVVQQRGVQVAATLNDFAARLTTASDGASLRLKSTLDEVNRLTGQVAELNKQIVGTEVSGRGANDLRDERDRVLDALSGITNTQIIERANGSVGVFLGGALLVDGTSRKKLETTGSDPVRFAVAGDNEPITGVEGTLGAIAEVLNTDVPRIRAQLDTLASAIVTTVNSVHRAGWSPLGEPTVATDPYTGSGVDFFNPAGTTAASITLAGRGPNDPSTTPLGVRNDPNFIAAGNVRFGTGSNTIALQLAALRDRGDSVTPDSSVPASTQSFRDYYRDVVTTVALGVQAAENSASVYATIVTDADSRRQSVAGVSTDEELVQLMRQQQAYVAATKLVNTVDQMAQAILNMV